MRILLQARKVLILIIGKIQEYIFSHFHNIKRSPDHLDKSTEEIT